VAHTMAIKTHCTRVMRHLPTQGKGEERIPFTHPYQAPSSPQFRHHRHHSVRAGILTVVLLDWAQCCPQGIA
jgi:hypothetical protein